ncbi:CaiB/BaiF CoA-transferase family protein [Polynucleobacter sp. MWH-HuK1]|uniref:CaiB/BaiF CoA transferase family protein n=1 Tax=Polynucleobacter sp. MWH-HuK1 TaxID=1743158 RepID=UPI001C0B46B7|nr:CoA transferase [Polynucleobacter sp. MWH-HuK1]MBU3565196.1 CoA transferase [Polynucleobacter sp. MWH-HuK1]
MSNSNVAKLGPLSGITVVDLTRVLAGPYCTLLMADLGARVIKVEQPNIGDDSRQIGPFIDGESAYFMSINRNKESIALDLKAEADKKIFESLLETADVLVENFRPGTMEKLGYSWEVLHQRYPKLVFTSVSGFGQTGPYSKRPAYDMVVQAMGGIMSLTGQPGGPPTRVGVSIGDLGAGLYAMIGTQAALLQRERTGMGEQVDVAMLDCQVALLENSIARYEVDKRIPEPIGSRHPSITPFDVFKAKDGWMVVAAGNDMLFQRLCNILNLPNLKTDERFSTNPLRCEHHDQLKVELEKRLQEEACKHWIDLLMENNIPTGEYNNLAQVLESPQIHEREMLLDVFSANGSKLTVAGNPIHIGSFVSKVDRNPPALDQDRHEIMKELNLD